MSRYLPFILIIACLFATQRFYGQETETKVVDFEADVMRPVKIADSSALTLVGNVVFHHNGAVITCDSAVRYNERMMDCFNNVIINQEDTYIYGDRVDYNGNINTARVYSPIVKMVDKDAVFYTYNLSFNTLDKVGHFTGGGTMLQADSIRMESLEGFYYVDERILVGFREVEMENPEYQMKSDSITYDMNTEVASFFTPSYIWNTNDEFLTASEGLYDRPQELYFFTDNAYLLTPERECWADTMLYVQPTEDVLFLSNVQIVDEEQKGMAFGDYIRYWGLERKALLTENPVVVSFDEEQADTLYMRADSMFVFTIDLYPPVDSLTAGMDSLALAAADSLGQSLRPDMEMPEDELIGFAREDGDEALEDGAERPSGKGRPGADDDGSLPEGEEPPGEGGELGPGSEPGAEGTIADSVAREKTAKELKQEEREISRQAKEEARRAKDEIRRAKLKARRDAIEQKRLSRMHPDSLARRDSLMRMDSLNRIHDSIHAREHFVEDSIRKAFLADSLQQAQLADTIPLSKDSIQRELYGYYNVRIYRSDFQAVSDSMTAFTIDSTIHMYIEPVLWNENNQVKSEVVDIYTRNQQIHKAVFTGEPIMSQEVDTAHYNQIKGKIIEAFFSGGEIYRMDVNGNGQTYYYMEEGDSTDRYINGFMTVECSDISFYFEEQQIEQIVWRGNPDYYIYPMDKIPDNISQTLPGFVWEGHRRPELIDVFDRVMRPSMREYYESLEQPLYPITQKIDADRERFTTQGIWYDRNDQLSTQALEFIRSLN